MNRSIRLASGLCGLLIFGCADQPTELKQQRIYAMGTWVDVSFHEADAAAAQSIVAEIETVLSAFERDYYAWVPGQLAELNDAMHSGEPALVTAPLAALIGEAQRLSALSDGFFEPGLGALVELWGFHTSTQVPRPPPSAGDISELLDAGTRIASLRIDGLRIESSSRGLTLDLGGIAKGAAVDTLISLMLERGVDHAIVNAGGDLRVIGRSGGRQDERLWRVGIQHPRESALLGVIELESGEAAFTSGDYERFYDHGGTRLHHILDPRTGYPVTHTQAVTVIAADGVTADAAATALFVAGSDRWRQVARRLGIDYALRVDATGELDLTAPMRDRLSPATGGDLAIMSPPDKDGTD
ncbi:MAG: FAD:protein FMN transferase [Gammaproteobacteria bacterium]